MASITKVAGSWRVLIRRKGCKSICKTFGTKVAAQRWALETETALVEGRSYSPATVTINDLIDAYRSAREKSGREILDTSTEHYMINNLVAEFGHRVASTIATADLVKFCERRKKEGAGPYTVNMEVSKLGTLLRHGSSLLNVLLPDLIGQARPTLSHLGLIGSGGKRSRRPTDDEVSALFDHFRAHTEYGPPMEDLMKVAMIVGLRRGELLALRWSDLDEHRRLVLVRNRKHPRQKVGNDQWIPLLGESWEVVQRQPRTEARIFPYGASLVSKYFTNACRALGIPDLHLHDLRHEAASALIEAGWDSRAVRLVTGHRTERQLDTYANLDPENLHNNVVPISKGRKAG